MKDKKLNQGKLGKWNEINLVTFISNGQIISHDIHQKASNGDIPNEGFFVTMVPLVESVREEHKNGTRISL
ncbi:hypothetical protein [Peribacillus frigoritolerans]|uniref:hypothetical protein n=1 Tax=Peribacillus frigoritolerans TaxID=450367 RepID=UPI000AC2A3DE|nr:hypothetical protein [Peribacillus frigoritolerans]USK67533.1 hypothetical protein LIT26_13520 [Peribacillus frigoritolerans]